MVDQLDAGDLDDAMAIARIEARRLAIQYDLAHQPLHRRGRRAHPLPRRTRNPPARKRLTIARNRRKLKPRLKPVGTTKSARRRFS
jgi:hypothetical protein